MEQLWSRRASSESREGDRVGFNHRRSLSVLVAAVGFLLGPTGCIVYQAVKATGQLAATSVVVVGKTATAAVKTTGKVATSAITTSGSLTTTSIESLAALAQVGMVRVPWRQGMTLYQAGDAAHVQVAKRAIALVRDRKLVYSAAKQFGSDPTLRSGDVVQLAGRIRP